MKLVRHGKTVLVKFQCPKCSELLEFDIRNAGSIDICQKCNAKIEIPGADKKHQVLEQLAIEEAERENERLRQLDRQKSIAEETLRIEQELARRESQRLFDEQQAIEEEKEHIEYLGTPNRRNYPAAVFVIAMLYVFGAISFLGSLFLCFMAVLSLQSENIYGFMFTVSAAFSSFVTAVVFAFMGEALQIALDIRYDLSKLVEQWRIDQKAKTI